MRKAEKAAETHNSIRYSPSYLFDKKMIDFPDGVSPIP